MLNPKQKLNQPHSDQECFLPEAFLSPLADGLGGDI